MKMTKLTYNKMNNYNPQEARTFFEKINPSYLKTIVKNFDKVYPKIGKIKDKKKGFVEITDKEQLRTLFTKRFKNNQDNKFTYKPSRTKEGRIYSDNWSLCGMNKIIRHTLCKEFNYDIDIVNAHPCFLVWYCEINNIPCKYLKQYCDNRNDFLNHYADQLNIQPEDVKITILSLINDQNREFDDAHPLYDFYEQMRNIQDKICELNKGLFTKCKDNDKKKQTNNPKGVCMSRFLQNIENKILSVMIDFCISKNIGLSAPCFDGFLAYKEDCDNYGFENLLSDIEKYVFETLDIPIKLSEKPMNKDIQDFLNNLEEGSSISSSTTNSTEDGDLHFDPELVSDSTLAQVILDGFITDKLFYFNKKSNIFYFYNEELCLYEECKIDSCRYRFEKYLKPYFEEIDLYNFKALPYSKTSKKVMRSAITYPTGANGCKNILYFLKVHLEKLPDDSEFIKEKFNRNPDLYPFKDMVYDFKIDEYRPRLKDDFLTFTTDREILDDYDEEYCIQYIKEILKTDDMDYVKCFSMLIGYFLTGYNNLKKFIIFSNPNGDNGKSVFIKLLQEVMGRDFCNIAPIAAILKARSEAVHDTYVFSLIGRRVVYLGEPDQSKEFDENFIKGITGNDTDKNIRRCGSDKNESVKIDTKMVLICNVIPEFGSDKTFHERLLNIDFANKFRKDPLKEIEILSKKDHFFTYFCKYASLFVANKCNIDFVDEMLTSTQKLLNDRDTISEFIDNNYEITGDDKDRVSKVDLWNNYNESFNSKKGFGRNSFYSTIETKYDLKIYKRTHYKGIKEINKFVSEIEIDDPFDFSKPYGADA
jgi:hypothetical protein